MKAKTKGQKLQQAYRQFIAPYSLYLQVAATFTLKQRAKIKVKRFENYGNETYEFWQNLSEDILHNQIHHFTARLTSLVYGNKRKNKKYAQTARPLVIVSIEGRNVAKRTHLHLAIGNIPNEKMENIEELIIKAWEGCDFAYKKNETKLLNGPYGWLSYITKEVGYTDNDALDIVSSTIPQFIQQSISTDGNLLTA
ncbi:hypothetical protein [Rhodoferax fermentans]|uniref:Uncharacterized protein n=1 Tax=Rhodoferax fermentans TaxID=28066 RepID=A0A1T1AS33_RHOFE|nr:hypothetical protein [Rhodoferax fermentans]MBK1683692.1 hypothetical protein [Rhodoferax fermentans]OOV06900.1 hypothetical protein RF819_09295 [Rhodoferax fermentans]